MKRIHFVESAWPKAAGHPVYKLLRQHPPEGWEYGLASDAEADLVVVPTTPRYDGKRPWVVFIEDWVTLFNDDVVNGNASVETLTPDRVARLRTQLAQPTCGGIICHHRGTFRDLAALGLTRNTFYAPVGIPDVEETASVGKAKECRFVFINSYLSGDTSFRCRGGEIVARAFQTLWSDGRRDISLKMVCGIPADLDRSVAAFLRQCPGVELREQFVSDAELRSLLAHSDCLLLPSHRVHVHSALFPMVMGLPIIASDGWGWEEYLIEGVNGLRVAGIGGVTSGRSPGSGTMWENYARWAETLPVAVPDLVQKMTAFVDDRKLLQRCGQAACRFAKDTHSILRQQRILASIYDGIQGEHQ